MTVAGGARGPEYTYRHALDNGEFRIQRCNGCGRHVFYPRILCPYCGASELEWIKPTGRGLIYATTVVRRRTDAGGDYNVCLVDLEEGPRLMSRVEGIAPERVRIGMRVEARIAHEGGVPMVSFVPAEVRT